MLKIKLPPVLISFVLLPACLMAEDSQNQTTNEPLRITITGSLSPQGMERVGKPVSVLNEADLKHEAATSIGEVLANQPGVSSTYFGPAASRPIIRGQGKERVRVLENGMEVGDVSAASDDHAVGLDPLATERIDILRGPSTLLYGSQAIGGVVNIVDGSIKEENIGKELTGKIDLRKGDVADQETTGAAMIEGQAGSINWHVSGFNRKTDDLEIPGYAESARLRELEAAEAELVDVHAHEEHEEDHQHEHEEHEEAQGTLENTDSRSAGIKAGVTEVWDDGYLGLAVRHTDSNYGVPGGHVHLEAEHVGEPEEQEDPVRIDLQQTRIESRGEVRLKDPFLKAVQFGAAYSDYQHRELEGSEVGTLYDRQAFETRMLLTHQHDEYLEGGWGLQLNHDDLKTKGEEAFVPSTSTTLPAIFFVEDFALKENLIWQFGGRYEHASLNPSQGNPNRDFDLMSTSTGLIYFTTKRDYSAAVNFSYGERAPNATELYADGAHLATQTYEIGDFDLDRERSLGSELILRKLTGATRLGITGFAQKYYDYLNLSPNGEEIDNYQVFEYENINARFYGLELELEQDLWVSGAKQLMFYSSLDYVRAKNTSDDQNLPRITPLRNKVGLRYDYHNLSTYLEGIFAASQNDTAEFELPTDSYQLLNAGVNYNIFEGERASVELYVKGTNLTDEEARIHNSFLKDQAPLRGRAFFAGLTTYF